MLTKQEIELEPLCVTTRVACKLLSVSVSTFYRIARDEGFISHNLRPKGDTMWPYQQIKDYHEKRMRIGKT